MITIDNIIEVAITHDVNTLHTHQFIDSFNGDLDNAMKYFVTIIDSIIQLQRRSDRDKDVRQSDKIHHHYGSLTKNLLITFHHLNEIGASRSLSDQVFTLFTSYMDTHYYSDTLMDFMEYFDEFIVMKFNNLLYKKKSTMNMDFLETIVTAMSIHPQLAKTYVEKYADLTENGEMDIENLKEFTQGLKKREDELMDLMKIIHQTDFDGKDFDLYYRLFVPKVFTDVNIIKNYVCSDLSGSEKVEYVFNQLNLFHQMQLLMGAEEDPRILKFNKEYLQEFCYKNTDNPIEAQRNYIMALNIFDTLPEFNIPSNEFKENRGKNYSHYDNETFLFNLLLEIIVADPKKIFIDKQYAQNRKDLIDNLPKIYEKRIGIARNFVKRVLTLNEQRIPYNPNFLFEYLDILVHPQHIPVGIKDREHTYREREKQKKVFIGQIKDSIQSQFAVRYDRSTFTYTFDVGDTIDFSSLVYGLPGAVAFFENATTLNPDYYPSVFQNAIFESNPEIFTIDERVTEVAIIAEGGGSWIEEETFLRNLAKLNPHLERIYVHSVDINPDMVKSGKNSASLMRIIRESDNSEVEIIYENGFIEGDILDTEANYLLKATNQLRGPTKGKRVPRIFLGLNLFPNFNPEQQKIIVSNTYNAMSDYSGIDADYNLLQEDIFVLSQPLKGDPTTYMDPRSQAFAKYLFSMGIFEVPKYKMDLKSSPSKNSDMIEIFLQFNDDHTQTINYEGQDYKFEYKKDQKISLGESARTTEKEMTNLLGNFFTNVTPYRRSDKKLEINGEVWENTTLPMSVYVASGVGIENILEGYRELYSQRLVVDMAI